MINVKDAVQAAIGYTREFSSVMPSYDLRLEETVFEENTGRWRVVLSFLDSPITSNRIYKAFFIDCDTGDVLAMQPYSPF
jgi:hypothetical protein